MAGITNTFSEADDERLIHARGTLGLKWKEVGEYVGKPWQTCQWRYVQRLGGEKRYSHKRTRAHYSVVEAPSIAPTLPKRPRPLPLHQQLGIKTKVVEAIAYDRYATKIMKITLPAV